jgi:hypothetical protein
LTVRPAATLTLFTPIEVPSALNHSTPTFSGVRSAFVHEIIVTTPSLITPGTENTCFVNGAGGGSPRPACAGAATTRAAKRARAIRIMESLLVVGRDEPGDIREVSPPPTLVVKDKPSR